MRSRLSKEPNVKYSPTEASLFDVISSGKEPLRLLQIAQNLYELNGSGQLPLNWQPIVRVTLNQLMKKMKLNKEACMIKKIKTPGEKALTYQIERKQ